MQVLIAIALKSLLVAGVTLGLLELMKRRSAAERSWIAHIGLVALVLLAFAPLVLPSWNVETPTLFTPAEQPALGSAPGASPLHPGAAAETAVVPTAAATPAASGEPTSPCRRRRIRITQHTSHTAVTGTSLMGCIASISATGLVASHAAARMAPGGPAMRSASAPVV